MTALLAFQIQPLQRRAHLIITLYCCSERIQGAQRGVSPTIKRKKKPGFQSTNHTTWKWLAKFSAKLIKPVCKQIMFVKIQTAGNADFTWVFWGEGTPWVSPSCSSHHLQGFVNFSDKEPNGRYFQSCGLHGLCHNSSTVWLKYEKATAAVDNIHTKGHGNVPIKLY